MLQDDMNFCAAVKNICSVIKLWRMRHFFLEGKITTFKSLTTSKIVYLALFTIDPKNIIEELNQIQKNFLWSNKKCDISLKCSWIRRLYRKFYHD